MGTYSADSKANRSLKDPSPQIPPIPPPDKNNHKDTHPQSPVEPDVTPEESVHASKPGPPRREAEISREETRFLADVAGRPLSTTVSRYQRLNLSRRKGNAIRQHLEQGGIIEAVSIATRSGQVILYQLTEWGRSLGTAQGIDPGKRSRESLVHRYWVNQAKAYFEKKGLEVTCEHRIKGNGFVDLMAERPGERIAVEVETGKSDIKANLEKIGKGRFDRVILVATSPEAVSACTRAVGDMAASRAVEVLTWLDIS